MPEIDPLIERLREAVTRYEELGLKMADPDVISDIDRLRELAKEHSQLEPVAAAATHHFKMLDELNQARELVASGEDAELTELAQAEEVALESERQEAEEHLQRLLVPK